MTALTTLRRWVWADDVSPLPDEVLRLMVESIPKQEGIDRRRRLFDLLAQEHTFCVPGWMTNLEFGKIWPVVQAHLRAGEVDPEDVGKSDSQLKTEYRAIAERRVRLGLLIKAIARRSHIVVDDSDIADARANGYRGPSSAILEEKVVEYIFGLAGALP